MLACADRLNDAHWHGLPLIRMRVPPSAPTPLRRLEQPMVMLLTRGRVQLHAQRAGQTTRRRQGEGNITLLPPMADDEGVRWSNLQPVEYLSAELPADRCSSWLQRSPAWATPGQAALRFDDLRTQQWLHELERHRREDEPFGTLYTESISAALVACLDVHLGRRGSAGKVDPLSSRALNRVQQYIEDHLGEPLRVADLAAVGGYSPQHFCRLFREALGLPLHRHVMERRLALARRSLALDKLTLAEVALTCGFSSQAHLNRAFKAGTGVTPGQWRRQAN